ncbi:MAG: DUF2855 family protein [Pseudomonadales bacterium]
MSKGTDIQTFEVRKDAWGTARLVTDTFAGDLREGEVLLQANRFALTANNISYCSAGDALGYWGFFPAAEGWGRIPVMGYGDVVASAHSGIQVGERVWGFFPMSTHLLIQGGKANEYTFADVSAHRADYSPIYANFTRAASNPFYEQAREDHDLLLRGLFLTSWLVEDFMFDNGTFGAEAYVITSASSKTSIALAFAVKERGEKKTIGLTSAGNVAFVENLGCYDQVLTYDAIADLPAAMPVVMVDMAGSAQVISDLHHHFGDNMKYSCRIGATHYDAMGAVEDLPGAKPEFFFAPSHAQQRNKEWGAGEVEKRIGTALKRFQVFSDNWLQVQRGSGAAEVERVFQQVLSGKAKPNEGHILSISAD